MHKAIISHVILYSRGNRSPKSREHRVRVSENWEKVLGFKLETEKFYEKPHELYSSKNFIRLIKLRNVRLDRHVASAGKRERYARFERKT